MALGLDCGRSGLLVDFGLPNTKLRFILCSVYSACFYINSTLFQLSISPLFEVLFFWGKSMCWTVRPWLVRIRSTADCLFLSPSPPLPLSLSLSPVCVYFLPLIPMSLILVINYFHSTFLKTVYKHVELGSHEATCLACG